MISYFFFQAEDGIRDRNVTGVQTCALPILSVGGIAAYFVASGTKDNPVTAGQNVTEIEEEFPDPPDVPEEEIGRASCREKVYRQEVEGLERKKIDRKKGQNRQREVK